MGNKGGAPTRLNHEVGLRICDAVREGCYLTVAAARVGIIPYTLYVWNERGKREANARATAAARGEAADHAMSIYEWFHLGLEAAKAEARFDAETRVFQTNPAFWLKNGYARQDWREADTSVRVYVDGADLGVRKSSNEALGWVKGEGWKGDSDE